MVSRPEGHGLAARVLAAGHDLYAGHLFVFLSKRRTHLKVLSWDSNGLVILFKRIEVGRFRLPEVPPRGHHSQPGRPEPRHAPPRR